VLKVASVTRPPIVPDYDQMWTDVYGDHQESGPVHRHLKRIVREVLAPLDYATVLDVGCGFGGNIALLEHGRPTVRVDGADISDLALEHARQGRTGSFHKLDVEKGRLDGQWDLVHSGLILEHIPDDEAALRNMRAMTRKYLVATTIAGDFERYRAWDEAVGHVRNYRRGELEAKLARAGFRVRRSIYWGFPFYSPLARTLQNHSREGLGRFRGHTYALAEALYWLYYLNSWSRGDIVVVAAEPA